MAGVKKKGMTDPALKIFRSIERLILENGYPPTMKELMADPGHSITCISSVQMHLRRLEEYGYISRKFKTARSLCILKQYNEAD